MKKFNFSLLANFKCHLDYCSHIWVNTFESNIKPILKLQNRVIRLIFKMFIVLYSIKKNT